MKKYLFILTSALMALAVSCDRDPKPENEREISFTSASGEYLGDLYGKGTGNYIVTLRKGTFDEAGKPAGEAYELILDCFSDLAEDASNKILKPGIYSLGNINNAASGTYAPGSGNGSGTVLIEYVAGGIKKIHPIESGTFEVSLTGSSYSISAQLTDTDNILTKGSYSGKIEFTDEIPSTVLVFENARGEYYGDHAQAGTGNFLLYLYNGELDPEEELEPPFKALIIEGYAGLPADPDNFSITPGTYTYDAGDKGDKFTYGSGIFVSQETGGQEKRIEITGGTIEITLSGDIYTINANLEGADGSKDLEYKYSGPIRFANETEPPQTVTTFEKGTIGYYGHYFASNGGNSRIILYNGTLTDQGVLPPCEILYIETFSELPDDPFEFSQPPGTYTFDYDAYINATPFTFGGQNIGSYCHIMDEDYNEQIIEIRGGVLEISFSEGIYTITANCIGVELLTNTVMTDLVYKYSGPLETTHDPAIRLFPDLIFGEFYGDIGHVEKMDVTFSTLKGGDDGNITNGYELFLELFAPYAEGPGRPFIVTGTYNPAYGDRPGEFEFLPGSDDGAGNITGSHIIHYRNGVATKMAFVEGYFYVTYLGYDPSGHFYYLRYEGYTDNNIYVYGGFDGGGVKIEDLSGTEGSPRHPYGSVVKNSEPDKKEPGAKRNMPGGMDRDRIHVVRERVGK